MCIGVDVSRPIVRCIDGGGGQVDVSTFCPRKILARIQPPNKIFLIFQNFPKVTNFCHNATMKKIPDDIKEKIINGTLTNRAAATVLKISESWLSTLLKKSGYERTESEATTNRKKQKELVAARKEFRKQLARAVKRRSKSITQAAQEGNCSERTIYRILDEL